MKPSKFFYNLTPDIILDTVEKIGLRCTGKIMPLNSLENRVYSVELEVNNPSELSSTYDAYRVVKFYRPGRWSKEQIQEEHDFIAELAAQDIPVVQPVSFPDGSSIQVISNFDGEATELYAALFPRVGGRLLDELNNEQIERLGHMIARLHLTARKRQSKHRIKISPETFGRESLNFLEKNSFLPAEISNRYSQLVKQICSLTDTWLDGVPVHRVHGDLHHGNILWNDQNFRLVDFDDFAVAPAVQDLWLLMSGREGWQKDQRNRLIDAYSEICDFNYETLCLIEPLRALRMINFTAWIARRWEDPAFKNAFSGFNTPQYWRDHLYSLEECWQLMQGAEL
jgi:Ser/Thr protein kinase RdoA (MazF antagonist)